MAGLGGWYRAGTIEAVNFEGEGAGSGSACGNPAGGRGAALRGVRGWAIRGSTTFGDESESPICLKKKTKDFLTESG